MSCNFSVVLKKNTGKIPVWFVKCRRSSKTHRNMSLSLSLSTVPVSSFSTSVHSHRSKFGFVRLYTRIMPVNYNCKLTPLTISNDYEDGRRGKGARFKLVEDFENNIFFIIIHGAKCIISLTNVIYRVCVWWYDYYVYAWVYFYKTVLKSSLYPRYGVSKFNSAQYSGKK